MLQTNMRSGVPLARGRERPAGSSIWVTASTGKEDAALARKGYRPEHEAEASQSSGGSQRFVQQIPEELLDQILSCTVRGHADLRKIALTCKKWLGFASQETQWKRLCIRGWGHRSDIIQVPLDKDFAMAWREYYKRRLHTHLPSLEYMRYQQQMTVSIRSILINWLLAVIDEFQQDDEAFFPGVHHQTVVIFDKYCSSVRTSIQTSELQMIGAACAVMALHTGDRVEEIDMEYFSKASFYTDGACTAEEVLQVARDIADLFPGKAPTFLETASDHIDTLLATMQKNYPSSSTFCLAHYLGELALQAEASLKYTPVEIGASAYALSCHTLGWGESLWMPIIKTHFRELSLFDLMPCMADLQALLRQALNMLTSRHNKKVPLPHVIVKYSQRERQHVAKVIVTPSPWPIVCPHGCDRETGEECAECLEVPGEEDPTDQDEVLVVVNEDTQPATTEAVDEAEGGAGASSGVEVEADEMQVQAGAEGRVAVGVALKGMAAHRNTANTPVNSVCVDADSPVPLSGERPVASGTALGDSMVLEGSSNGDSAVHAARQAEAAGLQDVSFGVMSENNDNSFVNSMADSLIDAIEDRRSSLGYSRRESLGSSVLGAVLEERFQDEGVSSRQVRALEKPVPLGRVTSLDTTDQSLGGDVSGHWGDTSRVEHVEDEQEDERVVEVEVGVSDISINSDDEEEGGAGLEDGSGILLEAALTKTRT